MVSVKIHLPIKSKLELRISKVPSNLAGKSLIAKVGHVFRGKKANKFSKVSRIIFENEKIKKVFGTNLVFLFITSSLISIPPSLEVQEDLSTVRPPVVVETLKGVQYPVKIIKVTQRFKFYHPGLDLDGLKGDPIYPIMAGTVISTEYSRFGYGNNIVIDHGNKTSSLYAHLSKIEVSNGNKVTLETKLGEMGSTGRAFGDHLHLEIYENGKPVNPQSILSVN